MSPNQPGLTASDSKAHIDSAAHAGKGRQPPRSQPGFKQNGAQSAVFLYWGSLSRRHCLIDAARWSNASPGMP